MLSSFRIKKLEERNGDKERRLICSIFTSISIEKKACITVQRIKLLHISYMTSNLIIDCEV